MSVFWEPSVFGVMLILALIADFFTKDKLSIIRLVFFTVAIILTESTASYIIYGYFLIFLIYNKTAKYKTFRKIFASLLFLFSIIFIFFGKDILVYLAKILPNVFGKFVFPESIISFSTRFYSLPNYLKVFAKNPIFGFGGVTSAEIYYDISNGIVDAQTSTIGKIIASFGLAGVIYVISIILGIFLNKKIGLANKLFLFLFFIMLSHVQGQGEIIIINILYFIPFSLVELPNKFKEINKQINTPNIKDKKIFDVAFAKDNDGELSSNIIYSLVVRGISILLAIFTIPIYLRYFNQNNDMYGVWLAITSVLSIITVFDFGMGNGLKNRLIVDINKNDYRHSRTYISTTYFLTLLIGTFIFVLLSIIIFSLNDQTIIRLFFSNQDLSNVNITTFKFSFSIIMLAIGLNFGIKNINYILQAHQKNAIVSSFMLITNASLLLFLLIFANIIPQQNKIIALAIVYNVFLNLPLIIISYYLFSKKYKHLRPSFKLVNFKESKDVIRVGLNFFVVQLGTLFLWSTNEFIILFAYKNANLVTEYTIYYRLFSLLPILLGTVIQQPVWTAISKADADGDYNRIKRYITVLISIAGLFLFINILLTFMLPFVFNIWLGDNSPKVTLIKQIVFIIYSIIYITTMTIVIICNALSLFKAQIVSAIMAIVIKIPLIIILANTTKSSLSWENVILVNMLCYLPIVFYGPFEIRKYIKLKLSNGSLTYSFNNYKKQYKEINI
jgi:O-antigen/teichoic acid export membrane protein